MRLRYCVVVGFFGGNIGFLLEIDRGLCVSLLHTIL